MTFRERNYVAKALDNPLSPPRGSFLTFLGLNQGKKLTCAEIGVFKGMNARVMLNYSENIYLYLIDGYERVTLFTGGPIMPPEYINNIKKISNDVLQEFKGRFERVYKQSEVAVSDFPDEFFDYVYIDGEHLYDWVKRDIEMWYPKVKNGGMLAGHDYMMTEVSYPVNEFCLNNHKRLSTYLSERDSDWWFIK
jgi:hypothetical protein